MNREEEPEFWAYWYLMVAPEDRSLRQGDIFRGLPVYWLKSETPRPDPEEEEPPAPKYNCERGDYIVLTSSCDLEQKRTPAVLLAKVRELTAESLKAEGQPKDFRERAEVIKRGYYPGKFLLAPFPEIDPEFPPSWVALRNQVLLPRSYLEDNCLNSRLRLKHPIREKFGNRVGALFSAVGPEDDASFPDFKSRMFEAQVLRACDGMDED